MTFLADENFSRAAVEALRRAGFQVNWIAEPMPAASDLEVLSLATSGGSTLLTFDKDFGELAFLKLLPVHCGIVLFRLRPSSPEDASALITKALLSQNGWVGKFRVVTKQKVRSRNLAPSNKD